MTIQTDPRRRNPDEVKGTSVGWLCLEIDWPFPTWIEQQLYEDEFDGKDANQRLVDMFNALGSALEKKFAGDPEGIEQVVPFKFWTKLSPKATKMKPKNLKATMYQHRDYDSAWCLVEYDNG